MHSQLRGDNMSNNIKAIQATIHRNLVEITPAVQPKPKRERDERLRRMVASKLQRAKEGTRFLY